MRSRITLGTQGALFDWATWATSATSSGRSGPSGRIAPWYSLVYGYDLENGWVEVEGGGYLPAFVNDVPVLTIPEEEA
eukprot:g7036.t1